eukprot:scaffold6615_cov69-Cylindrotheca_fusiformis.AAC.1
MAVPYLRNPNRSRRGLDNVKLSESTYHQEPEYHHHVGEGRSEAIVRGVIGAIAVCVCCVCLCVCWERWKRHAEMERNYNIVQQRRAMERNYNIVQRRRAVANYRTTIINTMPTPTARSSDGVVPPSCSVAYTPSRQEKMLKNFKFQPVLPDKSNTDPKLLRKQDNDDSSIDNDDESDSVIQLSAADKDEPFGLSLRFLLSTWRRPTKNDECAICLEGYEA